MPTCAKLSIMSAVAIQFSCSKCRQQGLKDRADAASELIMSNTIISALQRILWLADTGNNAGIPEQVRAIVDALPL